MGMSGTILVVDDEPSIVELIRFHLEAAGFQVLTAHTGPEALELTQSAQPVMLVLDVMLPGLDGFEVCRRLRAQGNQVPILMLTARADEVDRVLGLEFGADDYLTKPFSPREMVARVKAILRRSQSAPEPVSARSKLTHAGLTVDLSSRQAFLDHQPLALTPTEFSLLAVLMEEPGRAFTRDELLNRVWGVDYVGDPRTVDVYIRYLRAKLGSKAGYIETVRGYGYRLRDEESAPANRSQP